MKKIIIIVVIVLVSVMCAYNVYAEDVFDGKVVKVVEGNKFILYGGTVVQLMGIDVPQTRNGNPFFSGIARGALRYTEKQLKGKKVRLEIVPAPAHFPEQSTKFAYVFSSGKMINTELLRRGLALISKSHTPDEKYEDYFVRMQNEAVIFKKGIWKQMTPKQEKRKSYAFQ